MRSVSGPRSVRLDVNSTRRIPNRFETRPRSDPQRVVSDAHAASPVPLTELIAYSRRMSWRARLRAALERLDRELRAIAFACRDPRVPWYTRALGVVVVAYVLSPIDLVPDSHPVIGVLDDLVLIPLGIVVMRRLIPAPVMAECRQRAETPRSRRSRLIAAAAIAAYCIAVATFALMAARGG